MSDLISRRQAIDVIDKEQKEIDVSDVSAMYAYSKCKTIIKQLPSAQPEIVRCKDCDWWTKQEDSLQGRCALLQVYPTGGWFCGNARRREVTE